MSPREVGETPIVQALILLDGIKARLELRKDAAEKGIAIGI